VNRANAPSKGLRRANAKVRETKEIPNPALRPDEATKRPRWLVPAAFAMLALILVGIASAIRLRTAHVDIDANVESLELSIGGSEQELINRPHDIRVRMLDVVRAGPTPAPAAFLSSLRALPNARLAVSAEGTGCVRITAIQRAGSRRPALIALAGGPEDAAGLSEPAEVTIAPGEEIRFCVASNEALQLVAEPVRLDLSRTRSEAAPSGLRLATIVAGTLRQGQTDNVLQLRPFDLIHLDRIQQGTLIITAEQHLHLIFSGAALKAETILPNASRRGDLRPTLLEYLVHSPAIQSIFGIITGLVGMLWGAWRYFSGSRSS
jgi:hypothetical protein